MLRMRPGPSGHSILHLQPSTPAEVLHSRDVSAAAKKPKPQKKKLRKPKGPISERVYVEHSPDDYEADHMSAPSSSVMLVPGSKVPKAPNTADRPVGTSALPEELYPVFKPPQSSVSSISDSKWSWGPDRPTGQQPPQQDVPMWNPKSGFMKSRAQMETEQPQVPTVTGATGVQQSADSSIPARSSSSSKSTAGAADSSSNSSKPSLVEPLPPTALPSSAVASVPWESTSIRSSSSGELPAASREQVLGSCLTTSLGMAAAAAGLHVFARQLSPVLLGTDQAVIDQLTRIPPGLESTTEAGYMVAAAAVVTTARFALVRVWPEFAEATRRSNKQVLTPLGWPDIAAVAALSGVTEELLFRGGLIPATFPDHRGVLLSSAVFGLLHVSGGRNLAFAGWASVVGWLYGAVYLSTSNIWVAAGAHTLANFASGAVWSATQQQTQQK